MNTTLGRLSERRREILAEVGRIPVIIEGTLSERERRRGGGRAMIYHQLQRWRAGHNDTRHIPSASVAAVRAGIEGYRKVQTLIAELARLDERAVLAVPMVDDSKKKPTSR
jgi:hypothetical protein